MYRGKETFGKVVEYRANLRPHDTFVRFENTDLTFEQFHRNGNRAANMIKALGLTKGDTCAVMLPNVPEFLETWLGLARLGVIEVPINVAYRGDLLTYILNKAECKALIIDSQWVERVNFISENLHHIQHVIVVGDDYEPSSEKMNWYSYADLIGEAAMDSVCETIQPQDPSLILFTSGTTGPSKGAILSHKANFALASACCDLMNYGPDDCLFTVFPLFHINARYATILPALLADSTVVMHNRFSASKFWEICRTEHITTFNYMGSMLNILMKQPEQPDDADNPVRQIQGAPAPLEIYDSFQQRFNIKITEAYGSTEIGLAMVNRAETFRKGSCGKALPFYDVEIHDENDKECPTGVVGEIVVRPKEPWIMFSGYYGMPEATVKSWQNLWFHTGDRGRMDEDGYFYFVDREKEVVRRKGENISSYEIERVINEHPKVKEAAVIGVPSELSEEEVLAVIVVKEPNELKPQELLDFCQPRMAHFAVPRYIRFMKTLPKTPSLRVEKYKLKEEGVTSDTWDRESVGYQVHR
ncbi:crotonobetaine/carnitine-CoA ligase [Alteribacillus persepolensis]|uniref:Crotonobetaine/carnitine-CoA ligase n=1 Tax=Alteribacillus persepolensis TaxID=568899 RepID=A0A1G8HS82_9BACI|nr:AMP-binding protein [Alteribacillus persepolensis]SDI09484.1 crotonobetaine/carnitine-CoA ligase [Alteribacillus persepolensis]